MNVTMPESQRQEFECFCADNNIDPLTLRGLSVWEGWKAAYLANIPATLAAAPTPPAQGESTGFKLTYKNGSTQIIDRAPDSFELRECKIEAVTLATPPAPEVEPVAFRLLTVDEGDDSWKYLPIEFLGRYKRENRICERLYTHPANDGLRKAAENALTWLVYLNLNMDPPPARKAEQNLRAELNKDKSC